MASLPAQFVPSLEIQTLVSRVAMRAFVVMVPRRARHIILPRYWSPRARRPFGWCTEDELVALTLEDTQRQQRNALRKQLKKLAGTYKKRIINTLARVGAKYSWTENGERYYRKIKFKRIDIDEENYTIYFHVDTVHLPDEVLMRFLRNEDVLENVSASCDRVVDVLWSRWKPWEGLRYRVNLKEARHGITSDVPYSKALAAIEERKKSTRLTVVIGAGEMGKIFFADVNEFPHAIIAGATGTGKSVFLKQLILTLALRNTPQQLRYIFFDFKGGVELSNFKRLPHLLMPIIKDRDRAISTLEFVLKEVKERMLLFEGMGLNSISEYNSRRFYADKPLRSLPDWVVVIDELASMMLDKELRTRCEPLLAEIVQLARAAGIYVLACTQRPSVDVIIGLIKANIPTRICFATASQKDSQVVIDTSDAYGLNPAGRMIYSYGKNKIELHGPVISSEMIADRVSGIIEGNSAETLSRSKRHDFTPIDYFMRALQRYGGEFALRNIWEDFKPYGVSRPEIETVGKEFEGKSIEIDGRLYRLEPGRTERGQFISRKLVDITPVQDPSSPDPEPIQPLALDASDDWRSTDITGFQRPVSARNDETTLDSETESTPDDPSEPSEDISTEIPTE